MCNGSTLSSIIVTVAYKCDIIICERLSVDICGNIA